MYYIMNDNELLYDIYYNKHNYDGLNNLFSKAKKIHPSITRNIVAEWLGDQQAYQQTKVKVGKKVYLPIYSESPYSFQIDLTFFPRYSNNNSGNDVLFTAININTRYVYAYYGKDKSMLTILGFIKKMEKKTVIHTITTDEGTEFKNSEFIKFCQDNDITLYFVKGDSHKLGIINRFHRTLKDKLSKFFVVDKNKRWIDVIDDVINNYNTTVNRGIGVAPKDVNNAMEVDIINEMRDKTDEVKDEIETNFEEGDLILIKRKKKHFDDKLLSKYSGQTYTVLKVYNNALDIQGDDTTFRVKMSDVLKVKPHGLVTVDDDDYDEETYIKPINGDAKAQRLLKEIADHNTAGEYYKNDEDTSKPIVTNKPKKIPRAIRELQDHNEPGLKTVKFV